MGHGKANPTRETPVNSRLDQLLSRLGRLLIREGYQHPRQVARALVNLS